MFLPRRQFSKGGFSRISHSDANFCFRTQHIQIDIEERNKHKWIIKASQRGLRGEALPSFAI